MTVLEINSCKVQGRGNWVEGVYRAERLKLSIAIRSQSLLFRPEIRERLAGSTSDNNKMRTYLENRINKT